MTTNFLLFVSGKSIAFLLAKILLLVVPLVLIALILQALSYFVPALVRKVDNKLENDNNNDSDLEVEKSSITEFDLNYAIDAELSSRADY
jgi:hypothetical protein